MENCICSVAVVSTLQWNAIGSTHVHGALLYILPRLYHTAPYGSLGQTPVNPINLSAVGSRYRWLVAYIFMHVNGANECSFLCWSKVAKGLCSAATVQAGK